MQISRLPIETAKTIVLRQLYSQYQNVHGPSIEFSTLRAVLMNRVGDHQLQMVLRLLRDDGLVQLKENPAFDLILSAQLTGRGVQAVETKPKPTETPQPQQVINVQQGYVQVGHGNTQNTNNVTINNFLNSLAQAIEQSNDVPEETKSGWVQTVKEMAAHPAAQTLMQVAATLAANQAGLGP